jgi:DNA topoisomerase-1
MKTGERTVSKLCPECGKRLVIRTNRETGREFLGCSQWPQCTHTEPLPQDIVMRRAGAPVLPGMEDLV